MDEEWRPVAGYEGWYEVSSFGRVRRVRAARNSQVGRIMKLQVHKDGYVFVDVCKHGIQKHLAISRLVCTAFHGPCPSGKNCNHKDGIKKNNTPSNLEWVTQRENCKHKYEVLGHSFQPLRRANPWLGLKGEKHPRAKQYIVTTPAGNELEITGLKHFCRENGLNFGAMVQIATGSGHSHRHKGWKCRHANGLGSVS